MTKNKNKRNRVRVIAGEWRGRYIDFPDISELRPSSDRVKETLFNWLMPFLENGRALDLFAGSGALGIEALSRGAAFVCFVEKNNDASNAILKNLEKLNAQNGQVINQDAFFYLESYKLDDFDMIFLDPPYALIEPLTLIKLLDKKLSPTKACRLFYEHSSEIDANTLPDNWSLLKQKKAGQVFFHLLLHQAKA